MHHATRRALLATAAMAATAGLAACQSLAGPSDGGTPNGSGDTLTVGFITPQSGPLAAFAAPDKWVVQTMQSYFDQHPIQSGGRSISIRIKLEDSGSTADGAGQAAQRLISQGAEVLMAHATPETTVPVSLACIQAGIPCITADTPLEPWALSVVGPTLGATSPQALAADRGKGIPWVHHFFWGLGQVVQTYVSIWDQETTNKLVGGLFPNDPDGQAWSGALPGILKGAGYTLDNPGVYDSSNLDFTTTINEFKAKGVQIVTGVIPPPDFAKFWQQAQQQGFHPKIVSVAKATEFPTAVAGYDNPAGLTIEQWWNPGLPYTSSLTGNSAKQLADAYTAGTGSQWDVVLGFSEALFEVLAKAVAVGGANGAAIDAAIGKLKLDTIVGTLDFTDPPYPNTAVTYPTGGQWVADPTGKFPYVVKIVSDPFKTGTPITGTPAPIAH